LDLFVLLGRRHRQRGVRGEHLPDRLAVLVERVRLLGVQVQRAQGVLLQEQSERHHAAHPRLGDGAGREQRPALLSEQVGGDEYPVLSDGVQARTLARGVLDLVDLTRDLAGRRGGVELRLIDDGDPRVVAALDRGHRQTDHLLQRRLRRRLRLQGTGYLSDRLRKAAVHVVLHDITLSGRTCVVLNMRVAQDKQSLVTAEPGRPTRPAPVRPSRDEHRSPPSAPRRARMPGSKTVSKIHFADLPQLSTHGARGHSAIVVRVSSAGRHARPRPEEDDRPLIGRGVTASGT